MAAYRSPRLTVAGRLPRFLTVRGQKRHRAEVQTAARCSEPARRTARPSRRQSKEMKKESENHSPTTWGVKRVRPPVPAREDEPTVTRRTKWDREPPSRPMRPLKG